jgi:hypothetical protein
MSWAHSSKKPIPSMAVRERDNFNFSSIATPTHGQRAQYRRKKDGAPTAIWYSGVVRDISKPIKFVAAFILKL